jgi:hypothetical protein
MANKMVTLGRLYVRLKKPEMFPFRLTPDWFVDVGNYEDIVFNAMEKHVTQCKNMDRNKGLVNSWLCYADRIAGAKYVEAFRLICGNTEQIEKGGDKL